MPERTGRASAQERGYTGAWQKASAGHLRHHPWCFYCALRGVRTKATLVDHATPHRGDMKIFWDTKDWRSSCEPCHNGAKQSQEKRGGGMRGCNEDGEPLDPRHHWNASSTL